MTLLRRDGVLVATTAVAVAISAQALTVHYNRQGNWTALYFTAADRPLPAAVESERVFRFPTGYDGQIYHLMSHDPLFTRGFDRYVDDPRLRYRRILVPLSANIVAGGRDDWIDLAYKAVLLLWLWLGAFWLACAAAERGHAPWWGLALLGLPAVFVSLERMTADVALAALCVAYARWGHETNSRSLAVLALAPLVRETGLLLVLAAAAWHLRRAHFGGALAAAGAALPALAWWAFVHAHTRGLAYPASFVPLHAILGGLVQPLAYADRPPIVASLNRVADFLGLLGILLALGMCLGAPRRWLSAPAETAAMLFAALAVVMQRPDNWQHVYDYGRVFSPLLLWLAWRGLDSGQPVTLLPTLLMLPKIGLQVGSQVVGVLLGIAGRDP